MMVMTMTMTMKTKTKVGKAGLLEGREGNRTMTSLSRFELIPLVHCPAVYRLRIQIDQERCLEATWFVIFSDAQLSKLLHILSLRPNKVFLPLELARRLRLHRGHPGPLPEVATL